MISRRLQVIAKSSVVLGVVVTIATLTATTSLAAPTLAATNAIDLTALRKQLVLADPKSEIGTRDQSADSLRNNVMQAKTPEDICERFREHMARGDLEGVLSLYDPEIAFVSESGDVKSGLEELRKELAPMVATKPRLDFEIMQVARAGNITLMHTWWTVSSKDQPARFVHAIEIARQQPNGEWRWLIGDPFTVGRLSKGRKG